MKDLIWGCWISELEFRFHTPAPHARDMKTARTDPRERLDFCYYPSEDLASFMLNAVRQKGGRKGVLRYSLLQVCKQGSA